MNQMSGENRSEMTARQRTASQRSKKDEWKCKLCDEAFKDDKAEILECEYCEEHICRKCLHLTSSEYKLLNKRSDMHWYCPPCEPKAMKNLKVEKEVQERCKEYFEKLEKRVVDLEKKIEDKPDRGEVEAMLKETEQRLGANSKGATGSDVDEKMAELRESDSRKNNVIIYGIEESSATDSEERKSDDLKMTDELCTLLETNSEEVSKVIRLGKRPTDGERKPRPMKIEFSGSATKTVFMKNLKKLSTSQKFRKISVTHDMTQREREENRKKVQEAKELNNEENSENFKHIAVGPPWDRRVVKFRKKKE